MNLPSAANLSFGVAADAFLAGAAVAAVLLAASNPVLAAAVLPINTPRRGTDEELLTEVPFTWTWWPDHHLVGR